MTSQATVVDCQFIDAGDNGVSVGEGTRLDLQSSRFERCNRGIEIKDGSIAKVDAETVILDCKEMGVYLWRKNPRYSDGGTLIARELTVIGSGPALVQDKSSSISVGKLHTTSQDE